MFILQLFKDIVRDLNVINVWITMNESLYRYVNSSLAHFLCQRLTPQIIMYYHRSFLGKVCPYMA